ncbi:MAG: type II secretion system protein [Gammaproteobacteria bacterium]
MLRKQALGFTLLELAIVILLISIFMGLGVSALDVQQTNRAFSETKEKQEKIKDALVTYVANFRRLPCPDTTALTAPGTPPDGVEDRVTPGDPTTICVDPPGAAISGFGVIPYAELGLSRDDALDGSDNFFTYEVSRGVPNEWALSTTFGPANGFFSGNGGGITLNGRNAAGGVFALNPPPGAGSALGIAAIIVSHGRNGLGAYTTKGTSNASPVAGTDEAQNADGDAVFFQRDFTDVAPPGGSGAFDDLVLALTPRDLLTPAIKDGALQSPSGQVFEQMRTIKDTVVGWIPANSPPANCAPPVPNPLPTGVPAVLGLPPTVTVDPWTQPINYVQASGGPINLAGPPGNAFCVWSNGPNRANDSGACGPVLGTDDIGPPPVTNAQLATIYSPSGTTTCF